MKPFPASDYILAALFVIALVTTVAGALIAIASPRIIRSVCGLVICCVGIAGIYYFLHSPFLALMEVLIYVGAVCITIVFAIMLAEPEEEVVKDDKWVLAMCSGAGSLIVSAAIFYAMTHLTSQEKWLPPTTRLNDGSVKAIGISLLTTYSLAFELISLALLVAILGALVIARPGKTKE